MIFSRRIENGAVRVGSVNVFCGMNVKVNENPRSCTQSATRWLINTLRWLSLCEGLDCERCSPEVGQGTCRKRLERRGA